MQTILRLVIADNNETFAASLRESLEQREGYSVSGVTGSGEEAAAVAQAMKADRLVLFVDGEPSLALGEDRQVELLHMNLIKADELLKEGALPKPTADALKLACRGAEGGVKKNVLLPAGEEHVLLLRPWGSG